MDTRQPQGDAVINDLERFLMRTERRALVMAELAIKDREEALDLVQESMLAFVKRYARKPPEQWPPLFYRVVQNHIRDWYRRSVVRNRWRVWLDKDERASEPIGQLRDPNARPPDELLEQEDDRNAILAAVAELPIRQQQAFLLRIWEGLNVAETATAMRCSQGTVKTHLSRALQHLRSRLGHLR